MTTCTVVKKTIFNIMLLTKVTLGTLPGLRAIEQLNVHVNLLSTPQHAQLHVITQTETVNTYSE